MPNKELTVESEQETKMWGGNGLGRSDVLHEKPRRAIFFLNLHLHVTPITFIFNCGKKKLMNSNRVGRKLRPHSLRGQIHGQTK